MTTLLADRPRILLLTVGVIVALAASAVGSIGRQEDPTITNLFGTVLAPYPGAAPGRVEALVTEPIEEELREIAEIDVLTSTSRAGIAVVSVELSDRLSETELPGVWSEVRDALGEAATRFPPGVPEPTLDTDRGGTAFTTISAILMRDGLEPNAAVMRRHAELLQDRLRQIPDTRIVRVYGAQTEEVRVTVDPARLAALGLTADAVSRALAAADAKVEAGGLSTRAEDILVEVAGEIEDLARIRAVPLATGPDGATVRVGDVARVARVAADPPAELALAGGSPAVLVAARMENDRQVDVWTRAARAAIAEFEAGLPGGLEHRLLFDQSRYVGDRFATLGANLALGIALVVVVLFATLGWRSALVVASVIPLATAGSLVLMQAVGLTIHQMSVTGLIVALGLLVDAAIVMCDEIRRRLSAGAPMREAVASSVARLAVPLLASTVTTILAFLPMALLPGPAGDFVGSIALAVIIMLTVSLALALTVTPAIARFLLKAEAGGSVLERGIGGGLAGRLFERSVALSLRNPATAVACALVLPATGFLAFPTLTAQFFPGVDRDQLYIQATLPEGTAIAETAALARSIDALLSQREEVTDVAWVVGRNAPAFYYNMVADRDRTPGFAEALVTTRSPEATERLIPELQRVLDRDFPEAQILVRGLVQGPPVDAPVELRLVGPDLETLRRTGEEVRLLMTQVPEITHARANLMGGAPKLVFELDEEKVRLAGLTLGEVARQLEASLDGALGGSLLEATEELPVRVRLDAADRDDVAAIAALTVLPAGARAQDGFPGVPLSALGDVKLVPSDSPIARRNGERVNTVQGFVARGVLPEEALETVRVLLAGRSLDLPPGYRLEVGGDSDARAETTTNLASSAALVVTLTVVTIVLTFGRFRPSLITAAAAGLSFGLAILALAIFGYPFGIQALIGAIGSIGVSVNAAIIILSGIEGDERAAAGDPAAIAGVVTASARHIVSTTVTTAMGFVPLILGGGGFWPPFAMAIAGGVVLSTVVSFYLVAPAYALLHRRAGAREENRAGGAATAAPLAA